MRVTRIFTAAVTAVALGVAADARAALIDLGPGSFTPAAAVISFDEFALGTVNPSLALAAGSLGVVTVSFGGYFTGQTIQGVSPVTLDDTTPSSPLALAPGTSRTVSDSATGATCPCLSGDPTYNGPIAVLFSTPVAAVGLKGGFFDAVGGTTIEAFDSTGASLGSITNSVTDFEFYGLADSTGASVIAGISFYITGDEPAGFQIDNLTFGGREVIVAPEPSTTLLLGLGLVGAIGIARRKRA